MITKFSGLFDKIADAFGEVERNDIRVTDIQISKDHFNKLIKNPIIRQASDQTASSIFDVASGSLWGAKIHIVEGFHVFKILGEENFINNRGLRYSANVFLPSHGLTIITKSRVKLLDDTTKEEDRAIETLREMITEAEFRKFVKYGFILVRGQSGDVYQIFRRQTHIKVWRNGQIIEEVCVSIEDRNVPVTDNLIAFKVMIETDENEFKRLGNIYKMQKAA